MAIENSTRIVLYIQFTNNQSLELSVSSLAEANALIEQIAAAGKNNTHRLFCINYTDTNRRFGINLEHIIYMQTVEIK